MVADCEASADARAARHNKQPLYERLGGHEEITAFVETLIELHLTNEVVKPFMEGADLDMLTTNLVDFIGALESASEIVRGKAGTRIGAQWSSLEVEEVS